MTTLPATPLPSGTPVLWNPLWVHLRPPAGAGRVRGVGSRVCLRTTCCGSVWELVRRKHRRETRLIPPPIRVWARKTCQESVHGYASLAALMAGERDRVLGERDRVLGERRPLHLSSLLTNYHIQKHPSTQNTERHVPLSLKTKKYNSPPSPIRDARM